MGPYIGPCYQLTTMMTDFGARVMALNWLKNNIDPPTEKDGRLDWRLIDKEVRSLANKFLVMAECGARDMHDEFAKRGAKLDVDLWPKYPTKES